MITLVGGTVFLMWLGEQITARGIGNGISLIIFAGIVANLPQALAGTLELRKNRSLICCLYNPAGIHVDSSHCFHSFYRAVTAKNYLPIPKRQVGNKMTGGSHLIYR